MYPKRPLICFQKRPLSGGFTFTHLLEKQWLPKIDGSFMSLLSHLPFWPWNHIPKRNHSFHYLRLWLMMFLRGSIYLSPPPPPKWRDQHVFRKKTHYEYGLEVRQLQKEWMWIMTGYNIITEWDCLPQTDLIHKDSWKICGSILIKPWLVWLNIMYWFPKMDNWKTNCPKSELT